MFGPANRTGNAMVMHHQVEVCSCQERDDRLHEMVKESFSLDNLGIMSPVPTAESKENERARGILESTTKRVDDRFEIGLLWRFEDVQLPNSYKMACRRLDCLEAKMRREPELAECLNNQMKDYVESGFARELTYAEINRQSGRIWYLPILVVKNPKKPIRGIRVLKRPVPLPDPPTAEELVKAENSLFRHIQQETFGTEIDQLRRDSNCKLPKSSPIWRLTPYIDEDGVLRHRGRINAATNIDYDVKRPIILPRKHLATEKIVNQYHRLLNHINHDTVINGTTTVRDSKIEIGTERSTSEMSRMQDRVRKAGPTTDG